ncbi:thermotolerance protein [Rutstroemia sp. NJR-2017a BVV2]|nr:thermotolerance protein [Rutstroemia sp. NJR-2017a BVV2]
MAAPLQTQMRVDGQWVTRTIDTQTLLRHHNLMDQTAEDDNMEEVESPSYGLLTQTVIPSPVVHWILPVRLRGSDLNDVAFIGDTFVEIKELKAGPHLHDVIRKDDFGFRIRNASVVGSLDAPDSEQYSKTPGDYVKKETVADVDMIDLPETGHIPQPIPRNLPPQFLVLQLDSGDSSDTVFLFLDHQNDGSWKFVSTRRRVSKAMDKLQAGMHLAVDPSSRYMAIGGSEKVLTIQALHSRSELNEQYAAGHNLSFTESQRVVFFHGAILKMQFLHPPADDDRGIILLVILYVHDKIRMQLYNWEAGDDLTSLRSKNSNKKGHIIKEMPLLLIPLRFRTAFILVNERTIEVYEGILHGAPRCIPITDFPRQPTELYQGSGTPLWTAWAKPVRLSYYSAVNDDVYLVREDGAIRVLEVKSDDDLYVSATFDIGPLKCNVGQAFTCLDYKAGYDRSHGDLLVSGGDASFGGTYLVLAKEVPQVKEYIQNWSPAMDLVTLSSNSESDLNIRNKPDKFSPNPDSVFVCSGKGAQSSITELRCGVEAKLGLEIPEIGYVTKVWALPSYVDSKIDDDGDLILLSFADRSAVIHVSSDAMEGTELEPSGTQLDLEHRTIAAAYSKDRAVQVTEQSIVILDAGTSTTLSGIALKGFPDGPNSDSITPSIINDAVICDDKILFTTYFGEQRMLRYLEPILDTSTSPSVVLYAPSTINTWTAFDRQVTCVSMFSVQDVLHIVTACLEGSEILIYLNTRHKDVHSPGDISPLKVPTTYEGRVRNFGALGSVVLAHSVSSDHLTLLCGTRNGWVIILDCTRTQQTQWSVSNSHCDRFGATSVSLTVDEHKGFIKSFFISCDSKVFSLVLDTRPTGVERGIQIKRNRIWASDASNPAMRQQPFNFISRLGPGLALSGYVVLASEENLHLAEIGSHRKVIPRRILLKGTPSRFIYSRSLKVFIVGATTDGRSTLHLIDPETGEDLGVPTNKAQEDREEFVAGLGKIDEKVFCLYEWPYIKQGNTYHHIVAGTSDGKVVMISAVHDKSSAMSPLSGQKSIRYWTRHFFKCEEPVYSVTGDSEGLYYCAKNVLNYQVLDLKEKRFVHMAKVELQSEAISLSYDDGKVYALTRNHSLQIIQVVKEDGKVRLALRHTDQYAREALHHLSIGNKPAEGMLKDIQIHLVSDRGKSVAGLWASDEMVTETVDTIFEVKVPSSVLRLRSANCRPTWDRIWDVTEVGQRSEDLTVSNNTGGSEILGLGIDGSLFHFTILPETSWRFLRYLVNVAKNSELVCEYTYDHDPIALEPERNPKMMHVDGDILRRVLDGRKLAALFSIDQPQRMEGSETVFARFCELHDAMHNVPSGDLQKDAQAYLEETYTDLEDFLRPVL